jgi:hypothetical protein
MRSFWLAKPRLGSDILPATTVKMAALQLSAQDLAVIGPDLLEWAAVV